jgi:hypothetical protein
VRHRHSGRHVPYQGKHHLTQPDKFPVLNAVLFGEGIINDAVAIVLFRTVTNLTIDDNNGITYLSLD